MKKNVMTLSVFVLAAVFLSASTIEKKFEGKGKLTYRVYFNAIPSGIIEWEYLGKEVTNGKDTEVIQLHSDAKIITFFDMTGQDKVFLDKETRLPVKVERDLVVFGKKEKIEEFYDQEKGEVTIIKSVDGREEKQILHPAKPIHNILALLYFFPEGVELKQGEKHIFNLPTQEIKITVYSPRNIGINGKKEAYFLKGSGAKNFNLWLDKETRLPLRLEFLFPLSKVSIVRSFQ